MCGINMTTRPEFIDKMNARISHRGLPGRSGAFIDPDGLAIGHVRLPIIGISPEFDQPRISGNHVFAFAGEIFNYKSFGDDVCDTETLMNGWIRHGDRFLQQVDGFFSFIHYDKTRPGIVQVVTDPLAKKPLYIHLPTLSVSSEMKALTILDPQEEYLQPGFLYYSSVAKWGYHIGERTPFATIRKIPRMTVLTINLFTRSISGRIWGSLEPRGYGNLRPEIEMAVNNRLVGEVPVSLLLSGGLDSSIIYKLVEKKTHDFTIFHVDNDEAEYLDCLNIPGDIRIVKLNSENVDINKVLYFNEGPVDLGSMLPQYAMSQAIRESCPDVRVILTGDGADELFGGYRRAEIYDSQYSDIFEELVYYHLPRLDKLSMAHTLELRSPFLSTDVVCSALSLPWELRKGKNYLKSIFSDIIPQRILDRKKLPLKSKEVLNDPTEWRLHLIDKFRKETSLEYQ